ncbi:MAG: 16S rRNA (cytosine(1402)-N(4))-methyltransferase RsmH [Acidobacteriota bacterium]
MHLPVLRAEAVRFLDPPRGGCFVDCTVGLGGHAAAILESSASATVLGIDRDQQALELAAQRLAEFGDRARLVAGPFDDLEGHLAKQGIAKVSGVLADLGVSSMQLEVAERGFSFMKDGPLDMRMGVGEVTARDIVNQYREEELAKIIKEYGEERHARRVARAIGKARLEKPIETTAELRRVIERAKPGFDRRRIHPATQVFQALRIEVNQELEQLRDLLDQSVRMLERDGRLVVISYHSLEDRLVKHTLRDLAVGEVEPITGRPRAETRVIEVLTRKPVRPSSEEVAANPRSRSARLRAARRL